MFDVEARSRKRETAYLVGIRPPSMSEHEASELLGELADLVDTLGLEIVGSEIVRLRKPQPRFLIGSGRTEQISQQMDDLDIDCVVFDDALSPSQQRNWESETGRCAIDRQEVILEIFSAHAKTRESVLQVALARMKYSLPRLTRAWTHLSRQRGGAKGTRGTGETQLETDRRLVLNRIDRLKDELKSVQRARVTQRKKRERKPVPVAAIVGYTNAGKSSLLRALTDADVLVEDKLFATLDATTRRITLDSQELLLSDTVGFVRKLPHDLIEAFKSTLEEAVLADFLIHVLDISSEEVLQHEKTTLSVLEELGALDKPVITVFNKIDRLTGDQNDRLIYRRNSHPGAYYVSAKSGAGLEGLVEAMTERVAAGLCRSTFRFPADRYDLVARIHRSGQVLDERHDEQGIRLHALVSRKLQNQLKDFQVDETESPDPAPTDSS